jgi:hypothetical protein
MSIQPLGALQRQLAQKGKKKIFLYSAEILTGGRAVLLENCP